MNAKIVATALLALALGSMSLTSTPRSAARPGAKPSGKRGVPRFSPEALLAADVSWSTVQTVAGKSFWPELPAFNSIVDEEEPQPLTAVAETWDDTSGESKISTRLYAYASPAIALEYLQSAELGVAGIDQSSPRIGDQHVYYVTTLADGAPSTRLYFIHGQIGVEVQVDRARWSRTRMASLGTPIDSGIGELLAGKLRGPALPAAALAHLPSGEDAPGPVLGTAAVPAESWALAVHKGSPRTIRDRLVAAGDAAIPFRRYLRQGSVTDVVETTLFTFGSAGAAESWFAPFDSGVRSHPADALAAGNTGPHSAFRLELDNYELQFVAGRYVGDVFCYAPYVSGASTGCEAAVRALAEKWYAQLSG